MTLRDLRIFLKVCDCDCSISGAAKALYLTQPAVSIAIQEIEREYHIRLFDRIRRRLTLTEAGCALREYSAHILSLTDDMEKTMLNWNESGTLRIGASMTIGTRFMPDYAARFQTMHPLAELRVTILPSDTLETMLQHNELDLALVENYRHAEDLTASVYMKDSLSVIIPPAVSCAEVSSSSDTGAPSVSGSKPVPMTEKEFLSQRFLLRERGSGTRELFEKCISEHHTSVHILWESVSTAALINAVSKGIGISVLPQRLIQEPVSSGMVRCAEVKGFSFDRFFSIVYRKDQYLNGLQQDFLSLCRQQSADFLSP